MMNFILLILSLITGCEAETEVKGCLGGWFEFNCKNSDPSEVFGPNQNPIHITPGDERGKFYTYHDKLNKTLTVVVNKLEDRDFDDYCCRNTELELEKDKSACQSKLFQTVHETATTTFTCNKLKPRSIMFLCKIDGLTCIEILATQSSNVSKGRFTLTVGKQVFIIEVRHMSAQDAGVYWCGRRSHDGSHRAALKEIELEVQKSPTSATPSIHPSAPSSTSYSTSSTQDPTTLPVASEDILWLIGVIAAATCVAALVLLVLVLICRRVKGSKIKPNGGAQNEDHCYAEIQELPQTSDSGTAPKSVYATADFPTIGLSPSPYSMVQLPNSCGDTVTGETPTYSTVNEPSTLADTILYYTVDKPQQQ